MKATAPAIDWPTTLQPLPDEPGVLACRFAPDTTLVQVSDAYAQAFGRDGEPLIGRPFLDLVPPDQHDDIRVRLTGLTAENPTQTYQHPVLYPDGRTGVQRWTDRAIFDEHRRLLGYQSVGRDISALEDAQQAMRESDDRFSAIVHSLREVFWMMDAMTQRIEYVSPAVSQVLGFTPGDLYDRPELWMEAVHPDDRPSVEAALLRVHEQDFDLTYRVIDAEGGERMVRTRGYPVGGRQAVGLIADVTTEQRSFELALRNEERFQALMDGSLDAIFLFSSLRDDTGRIVDFVFLDANRRAAELISRTRDQIVGQRLCELLPVNRTQGYFEEYRRVVETREPFIDEIYLDASEQGFRAKWLQRQAIPLGDGLAITTRDITQRKADELEIARLYRETQTILDAVPAYIFYKDVHNRVLRVNRAAAESIGRPVDEIEGRNTEELFPENAAGYYKDDLEVIRSGQAKRAFDETYDVPGRGRRMVRTDKLPMFDGQGQVHGVLVMATDVTEQRRAEIERQELDLALEERRMLGHELHDGLGQQLTGLRLLIESARKSQARGVGVSQATLDELATIIADATGEVRRLINGMLPERIAPAALPAALDKLATRLRGTPGLTVVLATAADADALAEVLTDEEADHLLMIAHEAGHNAVKHAQAGELTLRLMLDEHALRLEVSDDGRGIAESAENPEGTGKGMRIMRHRADMVQAVLDVVRNPRGGTTVRCVKPLPGQPNA